VGGVISICFNFVTNVGLRELGELGELGELRE
jgi:hypothetical protein